MDFSVAAGEKQTIIYVLSTSNPNGSQMIAEYVADAWQDLSHLRIAQPSIKFISLIDNTTGNWHREQIDLLQPHSEICHWHNPESLATLLASEL